jgi:hypothetical protein
MLDFSLYQYELKEVITDLVHNEFRRVMRTHKGFRFKCPLCDDTERKARGNFLLDNSSHGFKYKCFNSGCRADEGLNAIKFLKTEYPYYYSAWIKKCVQLHNEDEETKKRKEEARRQEAYNVKREVPILKMGKPKIYDLADFIKKNGNSLQGCISILEHKPAVDWCIDRRIPEDVYKKWLYVPEKSGSLSNRIIIPFDNEEGRMYFFQARTLGNDIPKYKNALSDMRPIYNYYGADFDKPVLIVEGPIDSLFLENSIALLGTKYNKELLDPIKQKFFLFDNDSAGKAEALKLLEQGENVFMWKKFIRNFAFVSDKLDINNLAIMLDKDKFTFEELKPYFTNNILMKGFV